MITLNGYLTIHKQTHWHIPRWNMAFYLPHWYLKRAIHTIIFPPVWRPCADENTSPASIRHTNRMGCSLATSGRILDVRSARVASFGSVFLTHPPDGNRSASLCDDVFESAFCPLPAFCPYSSFTLKFSWYAIFLYRLKTLSRPPWYFSQT